MLFAAGFFSQGLMGAFELAGMLRSSTRGPLESSRSGAPRFAIPGSRGGGPPRVPGMGAALES